MLIDHSGLIVGKGVSSIDFYQIVEDDHFEHMKDV